jgi:hypothetical protein
MLKLPHMKVVDTQLNTVAIHEIVNEDTIKPNYGKLRGGVWILCVSMSAPKSVDL